MCNFFEACVLESGSGAESAKWILNAGAKRANELDTTVDELGITPEQISGIIELRSNKSIGSTAANTLFCLLCETDLEPEVVAREQGLLQVTDANEIEVWVKEAIEAQPQAADDVRGGKDAAIGRLVGEVMKRSGGSADASTVRELLLTTLRS